MPSTVAEPSTSGVLCMQHWLFVAFFQSRLPYFDLYAFLQSQPRCLCLHYNPPPFDSTFNPVTARIQLGSELVVAKPEILVPPLWEGSRCAYVFISSLFPVLEMVLQPIYVAYKTKGLTCFLSQWCKSDVKTLLLFPAIVCCKIFLCQL